MQCENPHSSSSHWQSPLQYDWSGPQFSHDSAECVPQLTSEKDSNLRDTEIYNCNIPNIIAVSI